MRGQLRPREPFPSVRQISLELGINPNTAQKAVAALPKTKYCPACDKTLKQVKFYIFARAAGPQLSSYCKVDYRAANKKWAAG